MLDARPPVRWSQEDRNFIEALAEKGQQGEVSLKELNNLRVRIGGAAKTWLNDFIKKGNGVRVLVTLMWGRLLREPFGQPARTCAAPRPRTAARAASARPPRGAGTGAVRSPLLRGGSHTPYGGALRH